MSFSFGCCLDNYHVVIFVFVAFGSAFGVAYWLVINSTSLSIAVHTMDMLVSRAVGFAVGCGSFAVGFAFVSLLALVPLVVMCCLSLMFIGVIVPDLQGIVLLFHGVMCCLCANCVLSLMFIGVTVPDFQGVVLLFHGVTYCLLSFFDVYRCLPPDFQGVCVVGTTC